MGLGISFCYLIWILVVFGLQFDYLTAYLCGCGSWSGSGSGSGSEFSWKKVTYISAGIGLCLDMVSVFFVLLDYVG